MNPSHRPTMDRWQALTEPLGLSEALSKTVGDYLLSQYNNPNRHYHNTVHIQFMLDRFEPLRAQFANPLAAELAIWFHDAIYDASRQDNESHSEMKMKELLLGAVNEDLLDAAAFTILATKDHTVTASNDTNLILDLDMAILGQPWPIYEGYARGVMREYLSVYGETAYRKGRVELFLQPSLDGGSIFLTKEFKSLTEQAILNIKKEIKILSSSAIHVF